MKKKILIASFVITSVLLIVISFNIFHNITNFHDHRNYIKQPITEQKIQDWMTLNYLKKYFSINLDEAFGMKISLIDSRNTLKEYCEENELNCDELILSLEKYRDGK